MFVLYVLSVLRFVFMYELFLFCFSSQNCQTFQPLFVVPTSGHPYSTSMDMWSLGVLLFVMICGHLPFYDEDDQQLIHQIKVCFECVFSVVCDVCFVGVFVVF